MGLHSLRILAQAGFSGVFFAAKILRGELPRYRLPLPEFAANVIPCSAPLSAILQSEHSRCKKPVKIGFTFEKQKEKNKIITIGDAWLNSGLLRVPESIFSVVVQLHR